ncbi:SnoaL-like protein [Paraburkholderia sp. BL8N3]|jgi:hypothetical protein|nr:nuclear transport factor 2 family protein [Paraburkholderia sp. BL8N3]TCK36210.1 SnoaL-like protein [Paraburkholderia sp. BL8N3]
MTQEEISSAERACCRLVHEYCYAVDDCDADRFVEVFTADAVWDREGHAPLTGHEQLRAFFTGRRTDITTLHLCSNVLVNVLDADSATGRSYVTVFRSEVLAHREGLPPAIPDLVAQYTDDYRRTAHGWRIARRKVSVRFRGKG